MLKKLVILGKSDSTIAHIMDILESANVYPDLEIVNNLELPTEFPFDRPKFEYTITTELLDKESPCILGVTNPSAKMSLLQNFDIEQIKFIGIIHGSTVLSTTCKLGKSGTIGALVTISSYTEIGDFVTISNHVTVGHHVKIEDYVTLNPGCIVSGHTVIGRGTSIGAGAVVSDHVTIGENVIIGAGAVVVRDIPSNVIAYGNPCKPQRENGPRSA